MGWNSPAAERPFRRAAAPGWVGVEAAGHRSWDGARRGWVPQVLARGHAQRNGHVRDAMRLELHHGGPLLVRAPAVMLPFASDQGLIPGRWLRVGPASRCRGTTLMDCSTRMTLQQPCGG